MTQIFETTAKVFRVGSASSVEAAISFTCEPSCKNMSLVGFTEKEIMAMPNLIGKRLKITIEVLDE
jgi:hypothetical protein